MIETTYDKCKKITFRSRKEAKTELKKINRNMKNDKLKVVYYCNICQAWHHTSMNKKQSRNLTKKRNNEH